MGTHFVAHYAKTGQLGDREARGKGRGHRTGRGKPSSPFDGSVPVRRLLQATGWEDGSAGRRDALAPVQGQTRRLLLQIGAASVRRRIGGRESIVVECAGR